ncbi:MAG TPA: STAS domain-containing protein [Acidimicrobiales bacterium]|nr:STAS domain-containing protein [Acidimicrobiales bacterium]
MPLTTRSEEATFCQRFPARPSNEPASVVVSRALGTVVVTVHGDLDRSGSPFLAAVLDDLIEGQGNLMIVIDLRHVARVEISTVEAVAQAARKIAGHGGELALSGPGANVREALTATGLAGLILGPAPTPSPSKGNTT